MKLKLGKWKTREKRERQHFLCWGRTRAIKSWSRFKAREALKGKLKLINKQKWCLSRVTGSQSVSRIEWRENAKKGRYYEQERDWPVWGEDSRCCFSSCYSFRQVHCITVSLPVSCEIPIYFPTIIPSFLNLIKWILYILNQKKPNLNHGTVVFLVIMHELAALRQN